MNLIQTLAKDHENLLIRIGFLLVIGAVCLGIHFWERGKKRKQTMDQFKRDRNG